MMNANKRMSIVSFISFVYQSLIIFKPCCGFFILRYLNEALYDAPYPVIYGKMEETISLFIKRSCVLIKWTLIENNPGEISTRDITASKIRITLSYLL